MSEPGVPAPGEARIGPPHGPAAGSPLPVTVVAPTSQRRTRRLAAHTPPTAEARPLTMVAFESRQLRRSVISVLLIITAWLLVLTCPPRSGTSCSS